MLNWSKVLTAYAKSDFRYYRCQIFKFILSLQCFDGKHFSEEHWGSLDNRFLPKTKQRFAFHCHERPDGLELIDEFETVP